MRAILPNAKVAVLQGSGAFALPWFFWAKAVTATPGIAGTYTPVIRSIGETYTNGGSSAIFVQVTAKQLTTGVLSLIVGGVTVAAQTATIGATASLSGYVAPGSTYEIATSTSATLLSVYEVS